MTIAGRAILACGLALFLSAAAEPETPLFGVAGVPKALGVKRDYDAIFAELQKAGVTLFYPTFLYVMAPEPKSLGRETDFLPPCSAAAPAFAALHRHGIKLVIPGHLLYPLGAPLPPLDRDPLRKLLDCTGRDGLFGVASYDEPAHQHVPLTALRALYERVKQVDRTLPVLMVHAPVKIDEVKTARAADTYLDEIRRQSVYADIVGFDLYPIPQVVAHLGTPSSVGRSADFSTAISEHMNWLRRAVPGKRYLVVLQGFSYADEVEPRTLRSMASAAVLSLLRPPSKAELAQMARLSIDAGADLVVWWGQSMLADDHAAVWRDLLQVTHEVRAGAGR